MVCLAQNAALRAECRGLLTAAVVERVARDCYGFAAPEEAVIPFDDAGWGPTSPRALPETTDRWDYWLGRGEFPWRVPTMVFAVSAFVLGVLEVLGDALRRSASSTE